MQELIHTRLRQVDRYRFEVDFEEWGKGKVVMDEPEPLGTAEGPNAGMLLSAAVGHCLCASLMFCVGKVRGEVDDLSADVRTKLAKNDRGRWRVESIKVDISLKMDEENQEKFTRCRELFEDFCIVTGSVRQGIDVDVDVSISAPDGA